MGSGSNSTTMASAARCAISALVAATAAMISPS
jgi:hypothetical protein